MEMNTAPRHIGVNATEHPLPGPSRWKTTMTRILFAALIAASAAAVPLAASAKQVPAGAAGAIAHFNQSREVGERLRLPRERARAALPSRSFEIARRIVNGSADSQDGKILGRGTRFND